MTESNPRSLDEILAPLDSAVAERARAALQLIRRQAIGAERFRAQARAFVKSDESPVTIADLLHQSQLQWMIHDHFAGDALVAEEPRALQRQSAEQASRVSRQLYGSDLPTTVAEVPDSGEICWIFDPIDGTKGYLGGRWYAIALGLFTKGRPVFGAMAVPATLEAQPLRASAALAFAIDGHGAWIADLRGDDTRAFSPLRSNDTRPSQTTRVAISLAHGGAVEQRLARLDTVEVVKLDSQAKYLAVATNDIDIYLRERRKDGGTDVTWDHVCGALIAAEAGCRVHRFDGEPVTFAPQPILDYGAGIVCYRGQAVGEVARRLITDK